MLKFIGGLVLVGGIGLAVAVGTGVVDFHTDAKLTAKGTAQVQELRNSAADSIRGASSAVAKQVETPHN